jgi:hypothetical protein
MASGKEVTIHEAPISAYGFTGSGYTVIDPQTGTGAYVIEGGARGGLLITLLVIGSMIQILGLIGAALGGGIPALIFVGILTGLNWVLKNLLLDVPPSLDLVLSTIELVIVLIAAALIAPELFAIEFMIESLLYLWSLRGWLLDVLGTGKNPYGR